MVKKCVAGFCFVVVDKLPGEVCLSVCIGFFERTNLPLHRLKETGFLACFFGLPLFLVLVLLDLFNIPDSTALPVPVSNSLPGSMLCRWLRPFMVYNVL